MITPQTLDREYTEHVANEVQSEFDSLMANIRSANLKGLRSILVSNKSASVYLTKALDRLVAQGFKVSFDRCTQYRPWDNYVISWKLE